MGIIESVLSTTTIVDPSANGLQYFRARTDDSRKLARGKRLRLNLSGVISFAQKLELASVQDMPHERAGVPRRTRRE